MWATIPSPPPASLWSQERVPRHLRRVVQIPVLLRLQVLRRAPRVSCSLSKNITSPVRWGGQASHIWGRSQRLVLNVRLWWWRWFILVSIFSFSAKNAKVCTSLCTLTVPAGVIQYDRLKKFTMRKIMQVSVVWVIT